MAPFMITVTLTMHNSYTVCHTYYAQKLQFLCSHLLCTILNSDQIFKVTPTMHNSDTVCKVTPIMHNSDTVCKVTPTMHNSDTVCKVTPTMHNSDTVFT